MPDLVYISIHIPVISLTFSKPRKLTRPSPALPLSHLAFCHLTMDKPPAAIVATEDFYDKAGLSYEKGFSHNPHLLRILETYTAHLPRSSTVLDCGCGTGKPVADMLAQRGFRVHGIDWSATMVQFSRDQVPGGTFEQVNMLDYRPSVRFDGIIALFSLFPLERSELEDMAAKWGRWIKPGGYFLLGTFGAEDCRVEPEMWDADGKFAGGIPFRFMGSVVPMGVFTKEGWDELLLKEGFEVIERVSEVFSPPEEFNSDDEPDYFFIARKKDVA